MKKLLLLTVIALLTIGIFSCQKDKSLVNNSAIISGKSLMGNDISPNVRSVPYIWTISSFVANGVDMTSQFSNYKFDIRTAPLMIGSGEIIAVNGGNTYSGKWDRVTYGEVVIQFPLVSDVIILSQLSDDWTLTNNGSYDLSLQTNAKILSFHTDGQIWPPTK
jgi:hypothetical protein